MGILLYLFNNRLFKLNFTKHTPLGFYNLILDLSSVKQHTQKKQNENNRHRFQSYLKNEIKGVTVRGFGTETTYGGNPAINTIYTVTLEGMRVCFLGTVENGKLPLEALEAIDTPDILFIPISGEGTLGPTDAHSLSVKLGAHVIIPITYTDATLKRFLKEDGSDGIKPVEKLTLKKKDVESKEQEIIVLKA